MGQSIPETDAAGARSQQRQPVPDNFAALLAALGSTSSEAGLEYERLRSKLIFFFARRSLPFPEDLADQVFDRLMRRIAEGSQIASVPAFALGIARFVAQEQGARKLHAQSMEQSFWDNVPANSATSNQEEELARMERCLKKLPRSEASLLRGYYLAVGGNLMRARKNLAESFGIPANTLRQRVFLARQSLRACMTAVERKKKG